MKLSISFKEVSAIIPISFNESQVIVSSTIEPYTGDYFVDPTFEPQILETAGKRMTDDLTVKEIKVSSVSNPFGGRTVFIGG